jgi:hypothetical protein
MENIVYFGKVFKYTEKGFGFIEQIHPKSEENLIFFHINKIKHLGLEKKLNIFMSDEKSGYEVLIWYTIEQTKKGKALEKGWSMYETIDAEHADRILLEREYIELLKTNEENKKLEIISRKLRLTPKEKLEIKKYIEIYKKEKFTAHHQVNSYIDNNKLWEEFKNIRSKNDHGYTNLINGIYPKIFYAVCEILNIKDSGGEPLIASDRY